MPISKTLTLQRSDLTQSGVTYKRETPYIPIHRHGYGRMDPNTPGKGFSVDRVSSSCVFVLHCPFTQRTIVAHSPLSIDISEIFTPMIEWVTNAIESPSGLPRHVEAVVMRGWACGTSEDDIYDHQEWMAEFCDLFSSLQSTGMLSANVTDSPKFLTSGTVFIDKVTGRVTYVELASDIRSEIPEDTAPLILYNPTVSFEWSDSQTIQTIFGVSLLQCRRRNLPILLQFDIDKYLLPMPLSHEARELIRSERIGEPTSKQSAILHRSGPIDDWIGAPATSELQALKDIFLYSANSRPCELCANNGNVSCTTCGGAWYCGEDHLLEDLPNHTPWCQTHELNAVSKAK
ncbi:hypothetical protein BJ138DRAFT_401941 [Hygrophoropsis aurantiaca]|uniref:Uncharacterized protein n=1 Tax=Hygrophoropsis aurantiaca TaxID=72124 RepID=A0ACB8ANA2_9AGAM|nr:hypothetical protein BJ138DRAFT_401941 [Hygrophoropsis aurantiaca]